MEQVKEILGLEQQKPQDDVTIPDQPLEEYGHPESDSKFQDKWLAQLKRIGLAAVGAVALAQDEVEHFVQKLVERGELAESESRKWLKDFFEHSRRQTKETVEAVESGIESGIESGMDNIERVLAKMSIPSKSDLDELAHKVDELTERVENLAKSVDSSS